MSAFTLFALVLLAVVTLFALSNPEPIALRFLAWRLESTLAIVVIGAAIVGAFLVFVSNLIGQRQLRGRIRELQARVRELEARVAESPQTSKPDQPS
ncbi:MAG: LapA family protein [Armatimonadota bacterium]|nr:LapA family protein [Armatimonadota bacterium]